MMFDMKPLFIGLSVFIGLLLIMLAALVLSVGVYVLSLKEFRKQIFLKLSLKRISLILLVSAVFMDILAFWLLGEGAGILVMPSFLLIFTSIILFLIDFIRRRKK